MSLLKFVFFNALWELEKGNAATASFALLGGEGFWSFLCDARQD